MTTAPKSLILEAQGWVTLGFKPHDAAQIVARAYQQRRLVKSHKKSKGVSYPMNTKPTGPVLLRRIVHPNKKSLMINGPRTESEIPVVAKALSVHGLPIRKAIAVARYSFQTARLEKSSFHVSSEYNQVMRELNSILKKSSKPTLRTDRGELLVKRKRGDFVTKSNDTIVIPDSVTSTSPEPISAPGPVSEAPVEKRVFNPRNATIRQRHAWTLNLDPFMEGLEFLSYDEIEALGREKLAADVEVTRQKLGYDSPHMFPGTQPAPPSAPPGTFSPWGAYGW